MASYKGLIDQYIEANGKEFSECAKKIHDDPEPSSEEYRSSETLCQLLEKHGFAVERGLKTQPTAFRAVYGSGPFKIGYMCE